MLLNINLKNKKKIFAIGLASGAALTFLIVLSVYLLYEPPKPVTLTRLAEETPPVSALSAYDFALPDEAGRFLSPQGRYFREPGTPWTEEDSREFWVDPRELATAVLTKQNRRKLDDIFERVP